MSIVLFGRTGYIGSAFEKEIDARAIATCCLSRHEMDYTDRDVVRAYLSVRKPDFVINSAAFIPPSGRVDDCKNHVVETWQANVHLPVMLAEVCNDLGITFCHISTACLYNEMREWTEEEFPTRISNQDEYCRFYLNTKFFAETVVREVCKRHYIWRIRLPFDEFDHPRNYLTKLKGFKTVWDQNNSLTHRGDFVKSALSMLEKQAPFGTYHMVNEGSVHAAWLREQIERHREDKVKFLHIQPGEIVGCTLSTDKLWNTGCSHMRPVFDAAKEALENWVPELRPPEKEAA